MKKISKTISLIGFQASGKTTLGKLLADQLQCLFMDTDQLIEQFHPSLSCSEIFKIFGSTYFRQLESQVITSLLYHPPNVIAPGGGCLLQENNGIKLKENSVIIYLKTTPEILKERIWQRSKLPGYLTSENPHEAFDRIYQERRIHYEKWADHTLSMDGLYPKQALAQLLNVL
jgi:shikimate kinase